MVETVTKNLIQEAVHQEVSPQTDIRTIVFLGRRSLQKLYLILHFGRMLHASHEVVVDTVNPGVTESSVYEFCGLQIREFGDVRSMDEASPLSGDSILRFVDAAGSVSLPEGGRCLLVCEQDRNSLEEASEVLRLTARKSGRFTVHRVYLDMCEGSRVTPAYLEGKLGRNVPFNADWGEWYAIKGEERDRAVLLNNQHDDTLILSGLGSAYQGLLVCLAEQLLEIPSREGRRMLRTSGKRSGNHRDKVKELASI